MGHGGLFTLFQAATDVIETHGKYRCYQKIPCGQWGNKIEKVSRIEENQQVADDYEYQAIAQTDSRRPQKILPAGGNPLPGVIQGNLIDPGKPVRSVLINGVCARGHRLPHNRFVS